MQKRKSAMIVIALTFGRLVEGATQFYTPEEKLVLDALRRSATALKDASEEQLAEYVKVKSKNPEQLRGIVSNVKGIYHELLFVRAENIDGDEVTARIHGPTNHPGADVEFIVEGDVIQEVQLKAVQSPDSIWEHLEHYPGIEVMATKEVAATVSSVESSGFSNAELSQEVKATIAKLEGQVFSDGTVISPLLAGAVAAAGVLHFGKVSPQQLSKALRDVSAGVGTATALDIILQGVS